MKSFKQFGPLDNFVTEETAETLNESRIPDGPGAADMEEAICAAYKIYCEKLRTKKWKAIKNDNDVIKYAEEMEKEFGKGVKNTPWHAPLKIASRLVLIIGDSGVARHKVSKVGKIKLDEAIKPIPATSDWRKLGQYSRSPNSEPKTDLILGTGSQNQISLKTHGKGGARLMSAKANEARATLMAAAARTPETKKAAIKKLNEYIDMIQEDFTSKVAYIKAKKGVDGGKTDKAKDIAMGDLTALENKNIETRIDSAFRKVKSRKNNPVPTKEELMNAIVMGTNIRPDDHKNVKGNSKPFNEINKQIDKIIKQEKADASIISSLHENLLTIYINIKDLKLMDGAEEDDVRAQLKREIQLASKLSFIGKEGKKDLQAILDPKKNNELAYQIAWEAATGLAKYTGIETSISSPKSSTANVILTVSQDGSVVDWHPINCYTSGRDPKIDKIARNNSNFVISLKSNSRTNAAGWTIRDGGATFQIGDTPAKGAGENIASSVDYTLQYGQNMLNEELEFGLDMLNEYYENFNSQNMSLLTEGVLTENRVIDWFKKRAEGAKKLIDNIIRNAVEKFRSWWNKIKDFVFESWNNILGFMQLDVEADFTWSL